MMRLGWIAVALLAAGCAGSSSSGAPTVAHPSTTAGPTMAASPPTVIEHFSPLPCDRNTTVGMEGCAEHRVLRADAVINREVRALWRSVDTDAAHTHLVAAQSAWQAYRKAACLSEGDKYAGGSLAAVVSANCLVRLTQQRVIELRRQLRP